MRLLAPAKINLFLRVGPPKADGFHPIRSWFCTIGLFDTLTLKLNNKHRSASASGAVPQTAGPPFSLAVDRRDLPADERNLVVRAARALADTPGRDADAPAGRREGVSAFLEKRIPIGAGLGGGSSDAARALLGLNNLWGIGWSAQRLSEFASEIGSDLPFFFHGPSGICTGRGEIVRPIEKPLPRWAVLVMPEIHMSTPAVYRRFDEMRPGQVDTLNDEEPELAKWARLPAEKLLPLLVNDLEAPAFSLSPELNEISRSVERLLNRIVRMSGSGSSLFSLYDDPAEAKEASGRVGSELKLAAQHVEIAPQLHDDLDV